MNESEWIKSFMPKLNLELAKLSLNLKAEEGKCLPYSNEIISYTLDNSPKDANSLKYETDILIFELNNENWKPRIVIEGKIDSVTTHDAITYSQKSQTHKNVHPFLRYGILLGNRKQYPLPGRLFRHGTNFDFMLSWKEFEPDAIEWTTFMEIIEDEFHSSSILEEIIFNSRSHQREKYTVLQRPIKLR